MPKTNCFLCDGPYWARDCPKRKAINVLINKKENEKENEKDAHVRSLQLLNTLKSKSMLETPQNKGLIYMEARVNGKVTRALVNTGVTHNFVSEDETKRLELQKSKEGGWFKAVNSTTKPSHGIAHRMAIRIGSWEGMFNFTVAPMDDFKMVSGMDLLQKVKVMPLPFLYSMVILKEKKPCKVPMVIEGFPMTPCYRLCK